MSLRRISPLELLHPDGVAKRCLVIGSNRPTRLLSEAHTDTGEGADLILLSPTAAECRTRRWLEEAVQLLAQKLAGDGLGYVLAPPRWKPRITSLLRRHGLSVAVAVVHLPDWTSSRYLVPLTPRLACYAFSTLRPMQLWKRRLAMGALRLPGSEKLIGILPSVGLVARHPYSRPLFDWLFHLSPDFQPPGNAMISMGKQGQTGTAVLHCFSGCEPLPSAVAKVSLLTTSMTKRSREAALMTQFGPGVRRTGARMPQPLLVAQIGGRPLLLQTVLSGHSIASLLATKPRRLFDLIERVVCWLARWNRSTVVYKPLDCAQLDQKLLAPAALLAPFLQQGEAYKDWLAGCCAKAVGTLVPFVAAHHDLTMTNILLDEQGRLGVVDWETGCAEAFPLVDFFYAVADAAAATQSYTDRPKAFKACFAPGGSFAAAVARLQMHLRRVLEVPADVADLCFHACWLNHAANEHHLNEPSERRRFLKIVQWLVWHRSQTHRWING